MTDNRNTILAVILSGLVLIGWQYFYNVPQMEKQRAAQQAQSELAKPAPQAGSTTDARDHATDRRGAAPRPMRRRQPASTAPVVEPRYRDCRDAARQDRHPAGFPAASR